MASLYENSWSLTPPPSEDEIDPMASISNISDAMLVFACGLLIALVVAWNVDLSTVTQVEVDSEAEIANVEMLEDAISEEGSMFIERGMVYQDPVTGKLYLKEMPAEGESAGGSGGTAPIEDGTAPTDGAAASA